MYGRKRKEEKMGKKKNVKKYVLEVIKSNESAVNLYKRQNFQIQRELECFQINKNQYNFKAD